MLIGRLVAYERGRGPRGEPGGSPGCSRRPARRSQRRAGRRVQQRRGLVGETWFPSRERAEGEGRSLSPPLRDLDLQSELVQSTSNDEVHEIVDRLGTVVE